jgi:hypothetical protein
MERKTVDATASRISKPPEGWAMQPEGTSTAELYRLLQETYFDAIDGGDADTAVTALHDDVEWVHTQVWEHDGHTSDETDAIHGRAEVRDFLTDRIEEMQVEGIEHKVREALAYDDQGSFRAEVVGPDGDTEPFLGSIELTDGLISTYVVGPAGLPR